MSAGVAAAPATAQRVQLLEQIAKKVGTPFWLYEAGVLRERIANVKSITAGEGLQARFAVKSCPATRILREMREAGIWIDAVSGNEVLRALKAGFPEGHRPPVVVFTADVFRDNALDVVRQHNILPNAGSPGMIDELAAANYRGPIAIRVNPGFGHGHVNACDTGGPSSKHGIWLSGTIEIAERAEKAGMQVVMLHAHIGSGPKLAELLTNLRRLAGEFARLVPRLKHLEAVSLGGGIPHSYREGQDQIDPAPIGELLKEAHKLICDSAGRPMRLEIEPGRYFVAPCCTVVSRIRDIKRTETNEKGTGESFIMVDAGFVDLIRPAMYGSYHRITIPAREGGDTGSYVVAGPLCESGDVFTRDSEELLAPRPLPHPQRGDLLLLHDAGAYGFAMASNYNSIGRAPQVWLDEDGSVTQISRRETVEDVLDIETDQKLI